MFLFLDTMAVQSIPTVEMTLEKQCASTTNPSGRSSRLSIRVKSIDSSSLETNSDGSPSTLSLIRQILEDQNPRMINPYVCPSDVSVVKIPVKISRLSRNQNSKITNSIGNPLGKYCLGLILIFLIITALVIQAVLKQDYRQVLFMDKNLHTCLHKYFLLRHTFFYHMWYTISNCQISIISFNISSGAFSRPINLVTNQH